MSEEKKIKSEEKEMKKGIYRHYKGGEYKILNEVKNSENQEEMEIQQQNLEDLMLPNLKLP